MTLATGDDFKTRPKPPITSSLAKVLGYLFVLKESQEPITYASNLLILRENFGRDIHPEADSDVPAKPPGFNNVHLAER